MKYDKTLVSKKSRDAIKSISELIGVLSDIEMDEVDHESEPFFLEDGTEVILGLDINDDRSIEIITLSKGELKYTIGREQTTKQLEREFRCARPADLK